MAKVNGAANRRKGHALERLTAGEFRGLGYSLAVTSRYGSRLLDDCKVDISGIPFNVQTKSGYEALKFKGYVEILDQMKSLLSEKIPERKDMPSMIFHKKGKETLVVMRKEEFYKLIVK